jgi:hypothetical protein
MKIFLNDANIKKVVTFLKITVTFSKIMATFTAQNNDQWPLLESLKLFKTIKTYARA